MELELQARIEKWIRSCLKKAKFKSEMKAKKRAEVLTIKTGKEFRAYNCPNCLGWHLTTTKKYFDK